MLPACSFSPMLLMLVMQTCLTLSSISMMKKNQKSCSINSMSTFLSIEVALFVVFAPSPHLLRYPISSLLLLIAVICRILIFSSVSILFPPFPGLAAAFLPALDTWRATSSQVPRVGSKCEGAGTAGSIRKTKGQRRGGSSNK